MLVIDASTDDTLEVMKKYQEKNSHIKVIDVQNNETFWKNKKYALTLGIKAATHNYLLFSDADCIPASRNWILEMVALISEKKNDCVGLWSIRIKKKVFFKPTHTI